MDLHKFLAGIPESKLHTRETHMADLETLCQFHYEGDRVMLAVDGEGGDQSGPRGRVSSGPDIASSLQCNRTSSKERLMGVRNAHYDYQLTRFNRHLDQQSHRNTRQHQVEVNKLEYDLKVMQIATRLNDREQKRRENPYTDTTYEDIFLQKSVKTTVYNPDDCTYLKKKNPYPSRSQINTSAVSNAVKQARRLLLDHDVKRCLETSRERREALTRNTPRSTREEASPELVECQQPPPGGTEEASAQPSKPPSILVRVKKTKPPLMTPVSGPVPSANTKAKSWLSALSVRGAEVEATGPAAGEDPVSAVAFANTSRQCQEDTLLLPEPRLVRSVSDVTFANTNTKGENSQSETNTLADRERRMMACFENLKGTVTDDRGKIKANIILPLINKKQAESNGDCAGKETAAGPITADGVLKEDYDVEQRLIELGIIKERQSNPQKNIKIFLPAQSLDGRRISTGQSRMSSVSRISRPVISRETLRKDGEEIRHRIDIFFDKLEYEKEMELQRQEELEAAKNAKSEDREPSEITKNMMRQNNLFTSYRAKIMKEKWKNVTSKMMSQLNAKQASSKKINGEHIRAPESAHVSMTEGTPRPATSSRVSLSYSRRSSPTRKIRQGWRTPSPPPNWTIPRCTVPPVEAVRQPQKRQVGVPGFSAERSKRHTATFKLAKMMQQLVANKSKFELMKIEEMKHQITDTTTSAALGEAENNAENSTEAETGTEADNNTEDKPLDAETVQL